jgi:hypothetical protein
MNYSETIYMRKSWVMVMVLISMLTATGISIKVLSDSADYPGLILVLIMEILLLAFIYSIRLKFSINKAGIYYRYYPFHFREHFIPWESVVSAGGRDYSPITEYGGWGIKGTSKNRAYNISGHFGLQIQLGDGRKILFESNRPEEIRKLIAAIRESNPNIKQYEA